LATFYHLDRSGRLTAKMQVTLKTEYDDLDMNTEKGIFNKSDAIKTVKRLHPKGISNHGIRCFFMEKANTKEQLINRLGPMTENLFELVRRAEFPDKPSRMESIFCWPSLKDAEVFRAEEGRGIIFQVSSEKAFIADQNLIKLSGTIIGSNELARKYWSGEHSQNPMLEALIPLPQLIDNAI
jgi:hypothetical protein